MKMCMAVLLISSLAFAQGAPVDAPLANPDAEGRSLILEQGDLAPYRGALLDEQEAVRRERARVRAETGEQEWKRIAIATTTAGAAVTVTLILLGILTVTKNL